MRISKFILKRGGMCFPTEGIDYSFTAVEIRKISSTPTLYEITS